MSKLLYVCLIFEDVKVTSVSSTGDGHAVILDSKCLGKKRRCLNACGCRISVYGLKFSHGMKIYVTVTEQCSYHSRTDFLVVCLLSKFDCCCCIGWCRLLIRTILTRTRRVRSVITHHTTRRSPSNNKLWLSRQFRWSPWKNLQVWSKSSHRQPTKASSSVARYFLFLFCLGGQTASEVDTGYWLANTEPIILQTTAAVLLLSIAFGRQTLTSRVSELEETKRC